jgi:hypothetical protein
MNGLGLTARVGITRIFGRNTRTLGAHTQGFNYAAPGALANTRGNTCFREPRHGDAATLPTNCLVRAEWPSINWLLMTNGGKCANQIMNS